jgi:uncharacterized protein
MWPAEWPDAVSDTAIAEALLETILGPKTKCRSSRIPIPNWPNSSQGLAVQHLYQNWRALGLPAQAVPVSAATAAKKSGPGRNDPCPCGSGKKYKKCCGADA